MSIKPYNSKQLTLHLRQIAAESETMLDDGRVITKGEALAILLWRKALGFVDRDPKTGEEVVHKPESWAINLIFDRVEGKVPLSVPDERQGLTASERVSDLAKLRINAHAVAAVSERTSPVDVPKDRDSGAEGADGKSEVAGGDTGGS